MTQKLRTLFTLANLAMTIALGLSPRHLLATAYYIAANGSDNNEGTQKYFPWLHAPGMRECAAQCAGITPEPGDRFIFRGGDTWHLSGRGTPVGPGWTWTWSGTKAQPIYLGVDQKWFDGNTWTRPGFSGDNPLSISAVPGCKYNDAGLGVYVWIDKSSYVTFDNFEFAGYCWQGKSVWGDGYFAMTGSNCIVSNNYFHGWTHTRLNGGATTDGVTAINASSQPTEDQGNQYVANVLDGSDSDEASFGFISLGGYDIHYNVVRHTAQGVVSNNTKYFYGNLIEYISNSADRSSHSNAFEQNGSQYDLFFYNNVFRHNLAAVNIWLSPGGNGYIFNNVVYDTPYSSSNFIAFDGAGGVMNVFNNTFVSTPGTGAMIGNQHKPAFPWLVVNNLFITDHGTDLTAVFASTSSVEGRSNVIQSNGAAAEQGYSTKDAYAPQAESRITIETGVNLTSYCESVPALCSDASAAVTYDAENHAVILSRRAAVLRPETGAWDAGAFSYSPRLPKR